jgi:hypothetical protein
MAVLRELLARFNVGFDTTALKKGDHAVGEMKEKLNKLGGLLAGGLVAFGLTEFVKGLIESGTEASRMSKRLGIGIEELEQLSFIADQSGVAQESLGTALKFLSKNLYEASTAGGETAQTFAHLHIATKNVDGSTRSADEALVDIAGSFENITNPAEKVNLAIKIFGRSGTEMIPILNRGRAGIEALRQKFHELGGGFGEDGVDASKKASLAIKDFDFALLSLKGRLATQLLPVITQFLGTMTEVVVGFINLSKNTEIFKAAIVTAGIVAASVLASMEVGFLLPKLAIMALILVVDDLITLFEGGHSVIGEFIDAMFGVGASAKFIEALRVVWQGLKEDIGFVIDQIKWIFSHGEAFGEFFHFLGKDIKKLVGLGPEDAAKGKGEDITRTKGPGSDKRGGIGLFSDFAATASQHLDTTAPGQARPNTGLPSYLLRPPEVTAATAGGGGKTVNAPVTVNIPIQTTGDPKQIQHIARRTAHDVVDGHLRAANAAATETAK